MSSRGRGRGRGGEVKSLNREQLNALGVGDIPPAQVTQPPPLYPLLDRKPVPLTPSFELDYLLLLKQDLIHHMQLSPSYLKMPGNKNTEPQQEIDKLVAQLPTAREKYKWNLFPSELRPRIHAKRLKPKVKKDLDVTERLAVLEKMEEKSTNPDVTVKVEKTEDEELEDLENQEEEQDEEMDDGTDYANNYFDNGENYEDEDDNLEDGPSY